MSKRRKGNFKARNRKPERRRAPTLPVPVLEPEETGFADILQAFKRSSDPLHQRFADYLGERQIVFIAEPSETAPLPPRLTAREMMEQCRQMERQHFPRPEGQALFDYLTAAGFIILSWPDLTKAAVYVGGGRPVYQPEPQYIYLAARFSRESALGRLAAEGGAQCLMH